MQVLCCLHSRGPPKRLALPRNLGEKWPSLKPAVLWVASQEGMVVHQNLLRPLAWIGSATAPKFQGAFHVPPCYNFKYIPEKFSEGIAGQLCILGRPGEPLAKNNQLLRRFCEFPSCQHLGREVKGLPSPPLPSIPKGTLYCLTAPLPASCIGNVLSILGT